MSEFDDDKARVEAGIEILDRACEFILDAVYHDRGCQYDILALLLTVYCRHALALGDDPQQLLVDFWPPEAPWVEGPDDNEVKRAPRGPEDPF